MSIDLNFPNPNNLDSSGDDDKLMQAGLVAGPLVELGVTGLKRTGGYLDEEFLPQLRGRKAVEVFKEMSQNDPTIGALLFTIDRLLRNVEWRVEPAGKTRQQAKEAKHVEECMADMQMSFDDFITEALSMLPYGWAWHEIVYKRREGLWATDHRHRSKHNDNLIGWGKFPIRAQETLLRWVFNEAGEVEAMVQMAPPRYKVIAVPSQRSLLFRFKHHKGNPEGISMIRNAYRPWFMKKRLEEFEAVGVERDLAGLPMVGLPAEMLKAKPGTDQAKAVDQFRKMVKTVRRNEQEGIVFPKAFDQDTKQPLYTFELLGGGGSRAFNTDAIIQRYDLQILTTVLADFIKVGHQSTGSYSLHTDKTGIFRTSLNSITESIADVLNRNAIPRLFKVNGWQPDKLPRIVPSDVDSPDIAVLAQFMSAMQGTGLTWFPDPVMENFVREAARLPKLDEDQEEAKKVLQQQSEATQFATSQMEYLQAQAAAQQAEMQQMPPEEQGMYQGTLSGAQERAHAETSGQAEQQAAEQEAMAAQQEQDGALQAEQVAGEEEQTAHDRMMAEREMRLKEKTALRDLKPKPKEKKK